MRKRKEKRRKEQEDGNFETGLNCSSFFFDRPIFFPLFLLFQLKVPR